MLLCVPPTDLGRWWPGAAAALLPAVERTEGAQTLDTVRRDLLAGDSHLWIIADGPNVVAALVTYVIRSPAGQRSLRCSLAGGSGLDRMAEVLPTIEEWAAHVGIARVEIVGRKGWGRVLGGYRETARTFVKELG